MELDDFRFSEEPILIQDHYSERKDGKSKYDIIFNTTKNCKNEDQEKECIGQTNICVYCYYSRFLYKLSSLLPTKRKKFIAHQIELRSDPQTFIEEVEDLVTDNKEYLNKIEYGIQRDYLKILSKFKRGLNSKPVMAQSKSEEVNQLEKDVFATYAWDSEEHKTMVLSFADFLRKKGFNTDIDRKKSQEETATDFTKMMHQGITDYKKVIIVLSKGYKKKADAFDGGVGTEYRLIINDIDENPNKYILVSFDKIGAEIFPANFKGREVIDLSKPENFEVLYAKLQDKELIQFSNVAKSKPVVVSQTIPDFEELMKSKKLDQPTKSKQEDVIELNEESTVHFTRRITKAFPGVRGIQWFEDDLAIEGLQRFFSSPLTFKPSGGHGIVGDPIWWFRGSSAEPLRRFETMENGKLLINSFELKIHKVAVFNGSSYWNNVIYIQTYGDEPTSLCEKTTKDIEEGKQSRGYVVDYFGYDEGRVIKPEQAEDGAGLIDGKYVKFNNPEIRERFLTPYNYILVAKFSPANSKEGNKLGDRFMNDILSGKSTFDEFILEYDKLPRHHLD